ncbi:hypothetical protein [uncultured Cyclobacterium sp.]|uniref:hypothetical protein n=1 Tax=uncultured Cyclobacterium sp. TaxID=453820 RepID=UPI0030EE106A|tara:strand:+ start:20140 stop:21120 length:981 start_codon:yes stop_codon:yes gene_type:complete
MKKLSLFTESFFKEFFIRITKNTDINEKHLSFYRVFSGLVFLLYFRPNYSWLSSIPEAFFLPKPFNIANLFGGFPPPIYFEITDYVIIIFLLATIIGFFSRFAFLGLFLLTVINNGFAYSLGKIDHFILGSLIFLVFAFTNSATSFAIRPEKKIKVHSKTLMFFGISIIFGFFTAGLQKAYHWIDFDLTTSGFLRWVYDIYFSSNQKPLLAEFFLNANPILIEIIDYSGVLFELSGIIFLLYSKLSWRIYLIFASFFHLANALILNIPFTIHFLVFGIWLLSSVLFRYKKATFVFGLAYFFRGIYFDVYLWTLSLAMTLVGLFKKD